MKTAYANATMSCSRLPPPKIHLQTWPPSTDPLWHPTTSRTQQVCWSLYTYIHRASLPISVFGRQGAAALNNASNTTLPYSRISSSPIVFVASPSLRSFPLSWMMIPQVRCIWLLLAPQKSADIYEMSRSDESSLSFERTALIDTIWCIPLQKVVGTRWHLFSGV